MISVVTISNRYGGVDVTWSSLRRQTHEDFEWIFCDRLYQERKEAVNLYTKSDVRVVHFEQDEKDNKAKTWLNHAENQAIRKAKGELIVLLQDYIYILPDTLERFWFHYTNNPKAMVTGVGHQYGRPGKEDVVDHKGLITVFKEPYTKKPEVVVWKDPRMGEDRYSFYKVYPEDIEFNLAALPKKLFYDVGGFDEDMDYVGHAWDNCSVCVRASLYGYEPYIDQSIESFSIRHDDFFDTKVKESNWKEVSKYHLNKMLAISQGECPANLGFLKLQTQQDSQ